jgi:serine protease Do
MLNVCKATTAYLLVASLMTPAVYGQKTTPQPSARNAGRTVPVRTGQSFLGIGVFEVDAERAKVLKLREEHGVEIKSVDENSPASRAGLREGDVVLQYNGQRVEGVEQFVRLVHETPVGRQVKLLVWRDGHTLTLAATIGQREKPVILFEDGFDFTPQRLPEIRLPDSPRSFVTWQSPTLGIESESLGSQLAEYFGVKEGVLVRSVMKDSAAEKAGLRAGDVIIKVDDKKVSGPREIATLLRAQRAKKSFALTVVRERREMVLTVTLDEDARLMPGVVVWALWLVD